MQTDYYARLTPEEVCARGLTFSWRKVPPPAERPLALLPQDLERTTWWEVRVTDGQATHTYPNWCVLIDGETELSSRDRAVFEHLAGRAFLLWKSRQPVAVALPPVALAVLALSWFGHACAAIGILVQIVLLVSWCCS